MNPDTPEPTATDPPKDAPEPTPPADPKPSE